MAIALVLAGLVFASCGAPSNLRTAGAAIPKPQTVLGGATNERKPEQKGVGASGQGRSGHRRRRRRWIAAWLGNGKGPQLGPFASEGRTAR